MAQNKKNSKKSTSQKNNNQKNSFQHKASRKGFSDKKTSGYKNKNHIKGSRLTDSRKREDNRNTGDRTKTPVENESFLGYKPMEIVHKKDPSVDIPCPYFNKCGGCQLLDVSYKKSLDLKEKAIKDLLSQYKCIKPIVGMDDPYRYRNKSVSSVARVKNEYIIGMYKSNSRDVVKIDRCLIQDKRADAIAETVRSLMKSFKMTSYSEVTGNGFLRHIMIRIGQKTNEIMVVLVTTSIIFPGKKNYVKALKEKHPEITTLVMNVNDRDTSMVLGHRDIVLYGKGYIIDELDGLTFRISPQSFYQINPTQTEVLYKKALEMADLKGHEVVVDAYSGVGTISLFAARHCKQVYGVELNPDAVRDAIGNAKANKIQNARFFTGDAGDFMVGMSRSEEPLDVVFMDPPRSGSTKEFIQAIGISKPKKVVYISCGPESLKRDLVWLQEEGYQVEEIRPVDMFPWTNHVECVVGIQRVESTK